MEPIPVTFDSSTKHDLLPYETNTTIAPRAGDFVNLDGETFEVVLTQFVYQGSGLYSLNVRVKQ